MLTQNEYIMTESQKQTPIRKGDLCTLEVSKLAFGGKGVAKENGFVIFVDGGLPGQQVRARISRKRRDFAEARVVEVLRRSNDETTPRCKHFGECGGCRFQNLDYAAQLFHTRAQIVESLEHIGGFADPPVLETLASPDQYYYRNKMEFSFGRQRWLSAREIAQDDIRKPRDFALGLHVRGRFDKILDLDECFLQSPATVEILDFVRNFTRNSKFKPYTTNDHSGFWRHLVIRCGKNTDEYLVNIVTADLPDAAVEVDDLAHSLVRSVPKITTVVHNINRAKGQTAIGEEERVLYGPGYIREVVGKHTYRISANSFFQTNTLAAERLYAEVKRNAQLTGSERVFDLYAGAGSISICISDSAASVTGFEIVNQAVRDAEANCKLNRVHNCSFIAGDLRRSLDAEAVRTSGPPDVVVIDPPRAGMHKDVLQKVVNLKAAKIVYVSCNPATFARDAMLFRDAGYNLIRVQPIDMFPMTPHIELVSLLGG